jgi:hypothetical protein
MIHRVFTLFFGSLALIMLATTLLGFALLTGLATLGSDTATAPRWRLVVVGDRGYAALDLLAAGRPVATVITRLRLDAHLCAPPPPRTPQQSGRPRLVGKRLPTLEQWRDEVATEWTTLTVPRWYSAGQREVEIVSQTAVWYHTGLPPVPIRWVLIRDPQGKFATQAKLCADLDATPQ